MSTVEKAMGDTLALVNVARQAFGYEPLNDLPRARPGAGSDCLYARALRDIGVVSVGGNGGMTFTSDRIAKIAADAWGVQATGNQVPVVPQQFSEVIGMFDGKRLPAYNVQD